MTKYLLRIKDVSGRDYSNVLSFKKEINRQIKVTEFLMADGATKYELAEYLNTLNSGSPVELEATEYEYMIQYSEGDSD